VRVADLAWGAWPGLIEQTRQPPLPSRCSRVESRGFKLSKNQLFIENARDIFGLYLNRPDRALMLCVDEKSQIQALDRSQ